MKRSGRYSLAVLSGILLSLSWPQAGFGPLVLSALVPLLFVLRDFWRNVDVHRPLGNTFFYSWLAMAVFNGLTGWWISLAHWSGLVAVVFIAASVEALLLTLWVWVTRQIGERRGMWALPVFWLMHEWVLDSWDMEWPWLKLGYAFADMPLWIQWYSWTGVYGGTLWVIMVNLLLFKWLQHPRAQWMKRSWRPAWMIILPVVASAIMYGKWKEKGEAIEVVVVQPNIEPYEEKFSMPVTDQLRIFMDEAQKLITDSTDYIIAPETLIPQGMDEDRISEEPLLRMLQSFRKSEGEEVHMVLGMNTIRRYREKATSTAREARGRGFYYDVFNTAAQLSNADSIPLYHKSKLVVGAEKMPFISVLQPLLGEVVIDFGGISGTNRTQSDREVFVSDDGRFRAAPIICWEAEFADFVADYVREADANIFFAITNDGWWGDSEGHRQHLHYARVRAIENRRSVARAANTGISAFINQRGDLLQTLGWEERGALRAILHANNEKCVYTRKGDVILRLAFLLFPLFMLYGLSKKLRSKGS